jgi:hypothetical protein
MSGKWAVVVPVFEVIVNVTSVKVTLTSIGVMWSGHEKPAVVTRRRRNRECASAGPCVDSH